MHGETLKLGFTLLSHCHWKQQSFMPRSFFCVKDTANLCNIMRPLRKFHVINSNSTIMHSG